MTDEPQNLDEGAEDKSQQQDDSWKSEQKVPYERFEKVVRQNQEYREKLDEELSGIKEKLNSSLKSKDETQQQRKTLGEWDKKVSQYQSWDEFIPDLEQHFIEKFRKEEAERIKSAEQEFDKEVDNLKQVSGLEKDSDIDKVVKFANEMSDETGKTIPLSVAWKWMNDAGKMSDEEKSEARKKASKKVKDSKRSSGVSDEKPGSYDAVRGQSLDDIVHRAKEELSK